MKNRIVMLSLTVLTIGVITTSCNLSTQKPENDKVKVEDEKNELVVVAKDRSKALEDSIKLFKEQSDLKIADYEKIIAELKEKRKLEKKEANTDYEKVLAELEQQNRDLKKRLDAFNDVNQQNWISFKTEFNHDIDKLGKAFKDITVNNVN